MHTYTPVVFFFLFLFPSSHLKCRLLWTYAKFIAVDNSRMRRIFRVTFYMWCNAYEEKSRDVVILTVSTLFNDVFPPTFSSANRFIMYKIKFCIREEIEILFSTIDFLVDHLPRYRRRTRYIFRGDFSKVGSFLSEAHPSFRESCSPDFLPRFLSARLLYHDLGATRIVVPLVPLVARESFDAARHGVAGQIESSRWKTRRNSISIRAHRRRKRDATSVRHIRGMFSRRERIPFDCRGLN